MEIDVPVVVALNMMDMLEKQGDKIDEKELEKVKNRYEAEQTFKSLNFLNNAVNMAYFELLSCAEDVNSEIPHYRAITPSDIRRVARNVFRKENCSVLYYRAIRN